MSKAVITIGETIIEISQGDITEQETDAIVNAANSSLMGGGGVDGAIHRKGGPAILEDCSRIRRTIWKDGLPPGEAVITSGGKLKAKFVIYTVGPVWSGGGNNEPRILASCYVNSLKLAESKRLVSISFPAISTGAYGYPIRDSGRVALNAIRDYLTRKQGDTTLRRVILVLFNAEDLNVYEQLASSQQNSGSLGK